MFSWSYLFSDKLLNELTLSDVNEASKIPSVNPNPHVAIEVTNGLFEFSQALI